MPLLNDYISRVAMVSYWTPPYTVDGGDQGAFIRHVDHEGADYVAACQQDGRAGPMPSACVWMVPGTDPDDVDHGRARALPDVPLTMFVDTYRH